MKEFTSLSNIFTMVKLALLLVLLGTTIIH